MGEAEPVIRLLQRVDFAAPLRLEPFLFMRQHLHFVGMFEEELQMELNESPQSFLRIAKRSQCLPRRLQHGLEGMTLDEIEQVFLAGKVVVEPRQAHSGGAREVTHGRLVIASGAEHGGRLAQDFR